LNARQRVFERCRRFPNASPSKLSSLFRMTLRNKVTSKAKQQDGNTKPANAFSPSCYRRLYNDYAKRRQTTKGKLSLTKYADMIATEYKTSGVSVMGRVAPPKRTSVITHLSEIDKLQAEPLTSHGSVTFSCGHAVDREFVNKLSNKWGYPLPIDEPCITCQTTNKTIEDEEVARRYITRRLSATENNVTVYWPDSCIKRVDVGRIINERCHVPAWLLQDFGFATFCVGENCMFRWLDYDEMNPHIGQPTLEENMKYNGAPHPTYNFAESSVLTTPEDTGLGICYWKVPAKKTKDKRRKYGLHNFVVFDRLNVPFETIVEVSKLETLEMTRMKSNTRKGTAGGHHIANHSRVHDPISCSAATKETRVFIPSSTTNNAVVYLNQNTGRIVKYSQISADMHVTDMTANSKRPALG